MLPKIDSTALVVVPLFQACAALIAPLHTVPEFCNLIRPNTRLEISNPEGHPINQYGEVSELIERDVGGLDFTAVVDFSDVYVGFTLIDDGKPKPGNRCLGPIIDSASDDVRLQSKECCTELRKTRVRVTGGKNPQGVYGSDWEIEMFDVPYQCLGLVQYIPPNPRYPDTGHAVPHLCEHGEPCLTYKFPLHEYIDVKKHILQAVRARMETMESSKGGKYILQPEKAPSPMSTKAVYTEKHKLHVEKPLSTGESEPVYTGNFFPQAKETPSHEESEPISTHIMHVGNPPSTPAYTKNFTYEADLSQLSDEDLGYKFAEGRCLGEIGETVLEAYLSFDEFKECCKELRDATIEISGVAVFEGGGTSGRRKKLEDINQIWFDGIPERCLPLVHHVDSDGGLMPVTLRPSRIGYFHVTKNDYVEIESIMGQYTEIYEPKQKPKSKF